MAFYSQDKNGQVTELKESVIEIPAYVKVAPASEKALATIEKWKTERHIDAYIDRNPETDYHIPLRDGSVMAIAQTITINGVQFPLVPGYNKIPFSVYEFLLKCPEQRRRVKALQPGESAYYGDLNALTMAS